MYSSVCGVQTGLLIYIMLFLGKQLNSKDVIVDSAFVFKILIRFVNTLIEIINRILVWEELVGGRELEGINFLADCQLVKVSWGWSIC